jgi:hypothetical protein
MMRVIIGFDQTFSDEVKGAFLERILQRTQIEEDSRKKILL